MKTKAILLVAVLTIFSLATGCTSVTGNSVLLNDNSGSIDSQIVDGKTTMQDVTKIFGEPQDQQKKDGNAIWTYTAEKKERSGMAFVPIAGALDDNAVAVHQTVLNIVFNSAGVVIRHDFTAHNTHENIGKDLLKN